MWSYQNPHKPISQSSIVMADTISWKPPLSKVRKCEATVQLGTANDSPSSPKWGGNAWTALDIYYHPLVFEMSVSLIYYVTHNAVTWKPISPYSIVMADTISWKPPLSKVRKCEATVQLGTANDSPSSPSSPSSPKWGRAMPITAWVYPIILCLIDTTYVML